MDLESYISSLALCFKKNNKAFIKHLSYERLQSKKFLIDHLPLLDYSQVLILGSWYPTYFAYRLSPAEFTLVDNDPSIKILNNLFFSQHNIKFKQHTADAKSFVQTCPKKFDLIINTSCEHMPYDMKDIIWDKKSIYAFQSNNYMDVDGHVNIKQSMEEFKNSTGLNKIIFEGSLDFDKYTRFTIIGQI